LRAISIAVPTVANPTATICSVTLLPRATTPMPAAKATMLSNPPRAATATDGATPEMTITRRCRILRAAIGVAPLAVHRVPAAADSKTEVRRAVATRSWREPMAPEVWLCRAVMRDAAVEAVATTTSSPTPTRPTATAIVSLQIRPAPVRVRAAAKAAAAAVEPDDNEVKASA